MIELMPETERLINEEMRSGHFQSIDELIVEGFHALRERRLIQRNSSDEPTSAAKAVASLRALRRGITLGGLRIKDLVHSQSLPNESETE